MTRAIALVLAVAAWGCAPERVVNPLPRSEAPPPPPGGESVGGDPITRDVSGGTAPGGIVHGEGGKDVDLASLWERQRVVIVFYMGHWCPHCQHQLGELNARLAEFTKANATVVAISTDTAEDASALHGHLGLGFDLYSDPDETTIAKWGVADFQAGVARPATFVVEPGGNIRFRHIGKTQTDRPSVDDILASLAPER